MIFTNPHVCHSNPHALMGNQGLQHEGDSITLREKGKCVTFGVADVQKAEISAYADEYNATVSRLVVEGLEMRLNQG